MCGRKVGGVIATRGCASLTPGYKPRLRLGLTCFACHRIHNHVNAAASTVIMPPKMTVIMPPKMTVIMSQNGLTCFACHRHNIMPGVFITPLQQYPPNVVYK